jgi:acyl-CoA synthetase (AMP-forming)/AMP-acid ligase II
MRADDVLEAAFGTVPDLVRRHAAERPSHVAVVQDDVHGVRRLDYAAFDALVDRIAAALQRDGVQPRDAVAVCAANSIAYAAFFIGVLRAGASVAPLSTSATAESLAQMRADSGARLYVTDRELDRLESWIATPGTRPRPVDIGPDWPFNIIYSSGTTGTPKGIVHPHAMRWVHVQRAARLDYGPSAVTLISTPLYSNTTLVSFLPTLGLGGTAILMAKFDVRGYLELSQKYRVTHTMLVPVQYQRLMAFPDFDKYDLSSFRMKRCTSAPFPAALKTEVARRWPGRLIDSYGLTEGGGACMLDVTAHPDKLHTVGVPAPGHDIRIIDDEGNEMPQGAIGEVVGHSAGIMTGYHNLPEMTRQAEWYDRTAKRFIRTGDIGRFDEDGFLVLVDRKKDVIISGGFNIYPSDLEDVVRKHPDVADVSVVGVPSKEWGETPVGFVVLRDGGTADGILEWSNQRLGKTQRLSAIEAVDHLPRSAIGKVLKRELRERSISASQRPARSPR